MRIRFDHPAYVRIDFAPGDELSVGHLTPSVQALLQSVRVDGSKVARIVEDEDERAVVDTRSDEVAVAVNRRRGSARSETVS